MLESPNIPVFLVIDYNKYKKLPYWQAFRQSILLWNFLGTLNDLEPKTEWPWVQQVGKKG